MKTSQVEQNRKLSVKSKVSAAFIGLIATAFFQNNALADVNYANTNGFSITNSSTSSAPVEAVYSHFVQHVDMWWPKDHTWWKGTLSIDELAGGCFCETHDAKSAAHMQIAYIEPNKKVVMTGGLGPLQEMGIYGALTWLFTETDSGTKVTLTYHASGAIQFNGVLSSSEDATNLVKVVDKVQAQQLKGLTAFSNEN